MRLGTVFTKPLSSVWTGCAANGSVGEATRLPLRDSVQGP